MALEKCLPGSVSYIQVLVSSKKQKNFITNVDKKEDGMVKSIEIHYSDLNISAQKQVLQLFGMSDESEGNFEMCPLFILACTEKGETE